MKIQQNNGQNGSKLDDHQEHVPEILGYIHMDKLFKQDHMACAADGQPLRDPLNDPEKGRF